MVAEKTYKELILEGEKIREKGDPLGAIPIFTLAHAKANKPSQISNALRHIGLCYEHLNELDKAEANYSDSLKIASMTENIGDIARTKRHLLSVELKKGNYEKAYRLGTEARKQMKIFSFPPSDLVWITHGVVKVLIERKAPKKEVREWVRIEREDLKWALSLEKNPIRRRVWLTGWLMDAAYAWAPWSWPLIAVAFAISLFSGLGLRLKQILHGKR